MITNATGTGSANGGSGRPVFSPDGTKMAFVSSASDLEPSDANGLSDVYVRDLATGAITLISLSAAGNNGGNGESRSPVFSPDSTKVAFTSSAGDLGPADSNGHSDIYFRDLGAGTTTLVSANASGASGANQPSYEPTFSPDSRKIGFISSASDFGSADSNGNRDIYLRNIATGTTTLVSVDASGTNSGNGWSDYASFDPSSGTRIAFTSPSNNLGPTDSNGSNDVYVRDVVAGTTTLVSVDATGTNSGNNSSGLPQFSPNGQKIVFQSEATTLGPTDTNGTADIYVRDLPSGTTALASVNAAGNDSGNGASLTPFVFSPSGTSVAFLSRATNLGSGDTNRSNDIYLRDFAAGTTTLVSVNSAGNNGGNGRSWLPVFSPDGSKIAFSSYANDLGDIGDTVTCPNVDPMGPRVPCSDVYVRDLSAAKTTLVSVNAAGNNSGDGPSGDGSPAVFTRDSRQIAFTSVATDLVTDDNNGAVDIFLATPRSG